MFGLVHDVNQIGFHCEPIEKLKELLEYLLKP
jgi:hypothetical protein